MSRERRIRIRPQALLIILLLAAAVWGYFVATRDRVFMNFDQADMATVARNLINGRGFTTDAMWLWQRDWGSPHHPEDSWPLLQPLVAALSFFVLGASTVAFQATIIVFFLLLLYATYFVGSRIFGEWEGVAACAIVALSQMVISLTNVGTNDIGAVFFYLAAIYSIYRSLDKDSSAGWTAAGAIFAGLAVNQKFQGVLIVISYAAWQLFSLKSAPARTVKRSLLFLAILIAMGLPLMVRNKMVFGRISYPSSKVLNSLASAWDPMYKRWRMNIVYYKPYWKHELPTYGYVLKHRGPHYFFVEKPLYEIKRLMMTFASFKIISRVLFLPALLGIFVAIRDRWKWVKWNGVVVICSLSFVLLGHMESRYFLFMIPLAALFAARFLLWAGGTLRRSSPAAAAIFAVTWMGLFFHPSRASLTGAVKKPPSLVEFEDTFIEMCAMFRKDLKPGEGVISYRAAEIAFESGRYAACPPNVDLAEFIELADRYKLRFFVVEQGGGYFNVFNDPGTQYWVFRQLAPLFMGREIYGFKLVNTYGRHWYVFRIPRPGEVDLNALPKLPKEPDDFTILLLSPERGGLTEPPPPLDLNTTQTEENQNPEEELEGELEP